LRVEGHLAQRPTTLAFVPQSIGGLAYDAIVHQDEAGKSRGEFVDLPVLLLPADLPALVHAGSPVEHGRLLAALWAEHAAYAMAVAPPGVKLKLQAATPALKGVDEDAFAVFRPDRTNLTGHEVLGWLWS
jgi:hypothetical protein